jgi:hypothetical protein
MSEELEGSRAYFMTQRTLDSMQVIGRIKQVFKAGGLGA